MGELPMAGVCEAHARALVQHMLAWLPPAMWTRPPACSLGMNAAGPSGCGKTATLTTLAAAVGFDVSEWRPPPAVQWEEAQYAGIQRRRVAGSVFNPQHGHVCHEGSAISVC